MINITELNKLRSHIDYNKQYLENINYQGDDDKKHSVAITMSILMDYYSLNQDSAYDSVTDGGDDNKFDGFYFNDDEDELSELVIIQSKYKNIDGETSTFTEDEIKLCISNCKKFLCGKDFQSTNLELKNKIKEYRKLLEDNDNPAVSIKLFFATNGIIHTGHKKINEVLACANDNITPIFVDATEYGHKSKPKNGCLKVNMKDESDKTDSIFDIPESDFSGKIISCNINELMIFFKNTGETALLNQNVRYLLKKSKINTEISESFINNPSKFCYLNNGITIVCEKFKINPTGHQHTRIDLVKPSIVNGGQTISTLYHLYTTDFQKHENSFDKANILIRLYEVPPNYMLDIAKATNSQNPINIVDLHANDKNQLKVKEHFKKEGIGLITKIGEDVEFYNDTITNENLLQVYASLYKSDPAKAKLSKRFIFNKYYQEVINDSINTATIKELYRSYEIKKYIDSSTTIDKPLKTNAVYSFIYAMQKINPNILNVSIPKAQIKQQFDSALPDTVKIIDEIISEKQILLGTRFSLNNLFKSVEIKDLLDIKIQNL